MKKTDIFIFFGIVLLVFLLKYPVLSLPYYWDELIFNIPNAISLAESNFNPFAVPTLNHTFLLHLIIALLFKITNYSISFAHALNFILAGIAMFFTYKVGEKIQNKRLGIIASILLFFTPLFFSQSGLLHHAIALTAFTMMTLYFFMNNNKTLTIISASILALTQETGILVTVGIIIDLIIEKGFNKRTIKQSLIYAIPAYLLVLWVLLNIFLQGWFLSPIAVGAASNISPLGWLFVFIKILKVIFFDNYRWIITTITLLILAKNNLKLNKKIVTSLIISIIFIILLNFTGPLSSIINNSGYFKHGKEYIDLLKAFSLLFGIWLFLVITSFKNIKEDIKENKLLYIILSITLIFFSFFHGTERYVLPAMPIYLLLTFKIINKSLNKKTYIIAAVMVVLFITLYSPVKGFNGGMENNMEYSEFVKAHLDASSYIETNYPNAVVLVPFKSHQNYELSDPRLGYVKKPIKLINPRNLSELNEEDFDLLYYSQFMSEQDKQFLIEKFNLKLEKEFNRKGKITEIYVKS